MYDKEAYDSLKAEIEKCADAYYNNQTSLVSDYEFDMMMKRLSLMEENLPYLKDLDSPTESVGAPLKGSRLPKVKHEVAMLSLGNTYNMNDVRDFNNRVIKAISHSEYPTSSLAYVLELKIDGLAISVKYKDGKLIQGVTRGNGKEGEDVTASVKMIKSIPHKLNVPVTGEFRGEVFMSKQSFTRLNTVCLHNGDELYANPRNAASGSLRHLDPNIVKERDLDAFFYHFVESSEDTPKYQSEALEIMRDYGLPVNPTYNMLYGDEIESFDHWAQYYDTFRTDLPYEIDGLVLKVDLLSTYQTLGATGKIPKWAIAYKFPTQKVRSKILDVVLQVGRTGNITPVAELEPVFVAGTKVSRATLHNFEEIKRKDLRIGDVVEIEKAAEIIPQVIRSFPALRNGSERFVYAPEECPVCGHPTVKTEHVVIKCSNSKCPEILKRYIEFFGSRDAMNIVGFGPAVVEKLVSAGLVTGILDLFYLKDNRDELLLLDKMGERSVDQLLYGIEMCKAQPYHISLYALGIPNTGRHISKLLAEDSGNIDSLMLYTIDDLMMIDDIGAISAESIYSYLHDEVNIKLISDLKDVGVNFVGEEVILDSNMLSGKTFVITGTLPSYNRNDMVKLIEANGGIISSSVSKKLDYLLAGDSAGSKLDKAEKLGIKIITEEELLAMLNVNMITDLVDPNTLI